MLDLKPAMSLKTHIVYIKEVGPGEGVSYNHTFVTKRNTKIATIPVGYADGYPRALSSKGKSSDPRTVCADHWKNLYGSVYG